MLRVYQKLQLLSEFPMLFATINLLLYILFTVTSNVCLCILQLRLYFYFEWAAVVLVVVAHIQSAFDLSHNQCHSKIIVCFSDGHMVQTNHSCHAGWFGYDNNQFSSNA